MRHGWSNHSHLLSVSLRLSKGWDQICQLVCDFPFELLPLSKMFTALNEYSLFAWLIHPLSHSLPYQLCFLTLITSWHSIYFLFHLFVHLTFWLKSKYACVELIFSLCSEDKKGIENNFFLNQQIYSVARNDIQKLSQ